MVEYCGILLPIFELLLIYSLLLASPVSDSCNQQSTNNVSNGVLRIAVTSGSHPPTGILRVTCGSNSGISVLACPGPIQLTGNNPQPSSILCLICIHDVTLGSCHFTVTAENTLGVTISFSGDWLSRMPLSSSSFSLFAKVLLLGTFGSLVVDS